MIVPRSNCLSEKDRSWWRDDQLAENLLDEAGSRAVSPTCAVENGDEGGEMDPPPYIPSPFLQHDIRDVQSERSSGPSTPPPVRWRPIVDGSSWVLPSIDNFPIPCAVRTRSGVYVPDLNGYDKDAILKGDAIQTTPAACMFASSRGRIPCFVVPARAPIVFQSGTEGKALGHIHVRPVILVRPESAIAGGDESGQSRFARGEPTIAFSLRYVGCGEGSEGDVYYETVIEAPVLVAKPVFVSP